MCIFVLSAADVICYILPTALTSSAQYKTGKHQVYSIVTEVQVFLYFASHSCKVHLVLVTLVGYNGLQRLVWRLK